MDRTVTGRGRVAGWAGLLDPGVGWLLLAGLGFGMLAIFAKEAYAAGVNLPTLLTGRFALAALLLWGLVLAGRTPLRVPPSRVAGLLLLGGIGYVGQAFAFFTALQTIPAAVTGLLLYIYPALVTLLAWAFLGEKLTAAKGLAVGLAFAGCVLVLGVPTPGAPLAPVGLAWAVAAAAIYSLYIIIGTRLTAGVPPLLASAYITTAAALVYGVGGLLGGTLAPPREPSGWVWIAALAVCCTVVPIAGFFAGLARLGPSRAAVFSTFEPVVTVALAAPLLGEPITWPQLAGGALILSALGVLHWRKQS